MKKIIPAAAAIAIIISVLPFLLIKWRESKKQPETKKELPLREPTVAGTFYPSEKQALSSQIDSFLEKASKEEKSPTILIVPHAGYQYSGQTAAYGFKQIENSQLSKAIIVGSTHQLLFAGAAVFVNGYWQTPLGRAEVDQVLAEKIIKEGNLIFANQEYHQNEHSLEVEIPFLQKVLPEVKIVPILMGDKSEALVEALASAIVKNLNSETVLIISTDLSHYPAYEDAKKVDQKTIEAILTGKIETLEQVLTNQMAAGISGLVTCACGEGAIKVGMKVAQKLGIDDIRLLHYANSGDIVGEKEKVVGYAAIGFYQERRGDELNLQEQEELLKIARETLKSYLGEGKMAEFEINHPFLSKNLGAFVTLRKDGQLRGCIGQFEPDIPLWQVVRQKAIDAAVHDTRFPPVKFDELEKIKIEVSVLSSPRKIDDWRQIQLGKHGVVLKKDFRSGLFLPQVATETGWDLETFMGQLCSQKLGFTWDCWQKKDAELYTFTAQVFEEE